MSTPNIYPPKHTATTQSQSIRTVFGFRLEYEMTVDQVISALILLPGSAKFTDDDADNCDFEEFGSGFTIIHDRYLEEDERMIVNPALHKLAREKLEAKNTKEEKESTA